MYIYRKCVYSSSLLNVMCLVCSVKKLSVVEFCAEILDPQNSQGCEIEPHGPLTLQNSHSLSGRLVNFDLCIHRSQTLGQGCPPFMTSEQCVNHWFPEWIYSMFLSYITESHVSQSWFNNQAALKPLCECNETPLLKLVACFRSKNYVNKMNKYK